MMRELPAPDEILKAWYALEDEAESSAALMQKVSDQFADLISPGGVVKALRTVLLKSRLQLI